MVLGAAQRGLLAAPLQRSRMAACTASPVFHQPLLPQAYARSYAHTFNGIALWKADKCGAGLKSLDVAAAELKAAKAAAGGYDAAPPATLNLHHRCAGAAALVARHACTRAVCLPGLASPAQYLHCSYGMPRIVHLSACIPCSKHHSATPPAPAPSPGVWTRSWSGC